MPAPDLIRGGDRFSEKIVLLRQKQVRKANGLLTMRL